MPSPSQPPNRIPAPGQILHLPAGRWRYTNAPRDIVLRVIEARPRLSLWYGGNWVWVTAVEVGPRGEGPALDWLVECDAIPDLPAS